MAVPDGLSIEATRITVSDTVLTNLEWLELNATDSLYFENAGLAHGSSNASDIALVSDAKSWPVTWAYAPLIVVAGNSYISNFTAIAENVSVIEGELTTGSSSFYSRSLVIELFQNSTAAGNLYVDSVLESSCTQKYTAVLRYNSPSNSLTAANFERGLMKHNSKLQSAELEVNLGQDQHVTGCWLKVCVKSSGILQNNGTVHTINATLSGRAWHIGQVGQWLIDQRLSANVTSSHIQGMLDVSDSLTSADQMKAKQVIKEVKEVEADVMAAAHEPADSKARGIMHGKLKSLAVKTEHYLHQYQTFADESPIKAKVYLVAGMIAAKGIVGAIIAGIPTAGVGSVPGFFAGIGKGVVDEVRGGVTALAVGDLVANAIDSGLQKFAPLLIASIPHSLTTKPSCSAAYSLQLHFQHKSSEILPDPSVRVLLKACQYQRAPTLTKHQLPPTQSCLTLKHRNTNRIPHLPKPTAYLPTKQN